MATQARTMQPKRFTLVGGRVIDPASGLDAIRNVHIRNGRIQAIEAPGAIPPTGEGIDVSGLIVAPGLIDVHVHLREPGFTHKETIATGTKAAVCGGFTTVFAMSNTSPVIDRPERVREVLAIAACDAACHVRQIGAVTYDHGAAGVTDFAALVQAGCVAVTDDAFPINDPSVQAEILRQAHAVGVKVIVHPEAPAETPLLSEAASLRLWLASAERVAGELGVPTPQVASLLHFAHVSTAAFLEELRRREGEALGLSLETCPHYWTLTAEAVERFGADAKMNPPLRRPEDLQAVRAALSSGLIPIIAPDHAPHTPEEKSRPFAQAPNGIVGLETSLALVLTELVEPGLLSLSDALAKMTCNPARAFGLPEAGRLFAGGPADIAIIDPSHEWAVVPECFASKGRNTPFAGRRLRGKAWGTAVGGEIVVSNCRLRS